MESSVESRFAISNGFLGVRGARSTTRGKRWVVPARTYVAGLFDSTSVKQAKQALVPAVDWLGIRIAVTGRPAGASPRRRAVAPDVARHEAGLIAQRKQPFVYPRHRPLRPNAASRFNERARHRPAIDSVGSGTWRGRCHLRGLVEGTVSGSRPIGSIRISAFGTHDIRGNASHWPLSRRSR